MSPDQAWERLAAQPVAVLATVNEDGSAHLVPFVFAPFGDRQLVSAVDDKPKRHRRLRRLENIRRDDRVTVLAHHYDEDWSRIWWVRAEGHASLSDTAPDGAEQELARRYPAHRDQRLGPWLTIAVSRITGWEAAG